MHFLTTTLTLLLLSLTTSPRVLAAPLTFTDIERRWSAGESDASIHASHNPRTATPSWPLSSNPRSATPSEPSTTFAESYDAVTQRGLTGRRSSSSSSSSSSNSAALMARIRDFASRLLRSKGEAQMIEEREEAPVLRPRKIVWRFSS